MKKKYIISVATLLLVVVGIVFFIYQKGRTTEELVSKVEIGMSTHEVESILSKPKKVISDNATVSENAYSEYQILSDLNERIQNENLETRMRLVDNAYIASENGNNMKEYIYRTKKREIQIYFVGGAVQYVNKQIE